MVHISILGCDGLRDQMCPGCGSRLTVMTRHHLSVLRIRILQLIPVAPALVAGWPKKIQGRIRAVCGLGLDESIVPAVRSIYGVTVTATVGELPALYGPGAGVK